MKISSQPWVFSLLPKSLYVVEPCRVTDVVVVTFDGWPNLSRVGIRGKGCSVDVVHVSLNRPGG